tara:strand:+ start:565 stop:792 length:228 start_codon:yes stop_codon:yes gene_type:complete
MITKTDKVNEDGTITRTITNVMTMNISKEMYMRELEEKQAQIASLPVEITKLEEKLAEVELKESKKFVSVEDNNI